MRVLTNSPTKPILAASSESLTLQRSDGQGHEAIFEVRWLLDHDQAYDRNLMNPPFVHGKT